VARSFLPLILASSCHFGVVAWSRLLWVVARSCLPWRWLLV